MTPDQKIALKQALNQHSSRMSIKDAAPEDVEQLPEDFQVPSYSANTSPVYDNQLFPKITSADDLIKLGYATPEGVATENGEMAISLKKAGALNDDYTLNDTGKAMMANPADLLEEENLPLYIKAKELDLDGSGKELSWGDTFSQFGKEVKEGAKNLAILLATASPTSSITGSSPYESATYTDKERAALNLETEEALGGWVKSGAALATGISKIAGAGTIKALADSEAEERLALSMLDQKFEKIDRDIQASKVSEVVDAMGQMAGAEFDAMGRMAGVELGLAGAGPDLTEARKKNIELVGEQEAAAIEKRGESAGRFAGMINPYGAAAMTGKVAFGVAGKGLGVAFKPISRSLLQADSKAALVLERTRQLASLERRAAGFQATAQAAERQAVIAESMAEKFSKAGLPDRANNALRLANQSREKGQEVSTRLGGFAEEIAKVSDDLAKATQSAGVADKVLQMGQVAKQIPYLPIAAVGKTLELTGRGMIGIDKGLSIFAAKIGADKAYNAMNKISSLSGLGGAGAALGLGPAAFIPAAAKLAWATAPYLKAAGEYVSLVGKEASKARGQIGFWKRIYEMPNKGPAHRMVSGLMDTATAGGLVTGMGSRVTKGLLASYPVDLAYEWVSEGGELNPNLFKQAAVETLFFGGTGAALGGITMGSANRIKALQNGDAMNFYSSISDPAQRVMYNGMPSDLKRVVGTFSASNPGAKIQFVDQGLGAYDRNTKTVMINPNAPNPLKPLLTHEFMHHMLNSGIGDGVIANLVGDGFQTGGILRSKDGGYDAQYESFKGEYVNRLRKQHDRQVKLRDATGDPMTKNEREFKTPDEKYLAEEYFIETNVDDMLGLVESGKLGKMAGRMIINDKVRALGDSILNKSAILRDLHFRIGGVMDNSGKMVTGNGFLGGKLYQSPEVRRMFQKMVSESVGRRGGIDAAKRKAREGVEISIQGKSDPILGELGSLWETDSDGSPLMDNNGDFVPLKKETDELRSQAGMLLVDDLKARQSRGETIPDGELAYNPENNTWSGQYLNDKQIDLLSLSGRFNSKQIKQLRLLNEAARQTSNTNADPATRGHRFSMIYQPALKKNRKGQWKYDQIKPQLRDVVPYGVEISKDGNILIRIMSTNQLFANVSEKAASKRGRTLYDGNMETILRDANAVIDLHGKNQATDAYFKEKYAGKWEDHKKFINSVFGNVGAGHKDINPLVASDRVDAVVKSYRLDRMNKATQLVGSTQLPYQNNLIKINYLPEGEPIMDANGEPKDLRYGSRPVDQAMPEQRQMPEVSPEDLNPITNKQEAQRLFADGKRLFAVNEMDEKAAEITSVEMLNSYPADAIGWMEPEQAPAPSQTRFMPEGVDEDKFYSQLDRVITDKVPTRSTTQQIINSFGEYIVTKTETIDGKDKTTVVGKFPYTEQSKAKSLAASVEKGRSDWSSPSKIKEEEIKWSGIEQALASLEKDGKVSKEDLLNYLRDEGQVRFEEVTLGGGDLRIEQNASGSFSVFNTSTKEYLDTETTFDTREEAEQAAKEYADNFGGGGKPTKFAKHTLPGGENYREVVLAIPVTKQAEPKSAIAERIKRRTGATDADLANYINSDASDAIQADREFEAWINASLDDRAVAAGNKATLGVSDYTSSHFPDIPNYVAHMRLDERTLGDGTRTLHSAEYQSDRHQAGRREGYDDKKENGLDVATREFNAIVKPSSPATPSEVQQLVLGRLPGDTAWAREALGDSFEKIRDLASKDKRGVADAPFRTTWPLQLFKRQLRDAVEGGFDSVSWDTGDTQNDRFDLSQSVDFIKHKPLEGYTEGSKRITIQLLEGSSVIIGADANGRILSGVGNSNAYDGKMLDEVIGKDVAQRILAGEGKTQSETPWGAGLAAADEKTLRGDDLKMGGSGMRGFYDNMMPKEIGKYVKQWKGKVEKGVVSSADESFAPQGADTTNIVSSDGRVLNTYDQADAETRRNLAQRWLDYNRNIYPDARIEEGSQTSNAPETPIWRVKITPEMLNLSQTGQVRYMPDGNVGENSEYATPPSEESARDAISTSKRPFWGKHRDSEEGEKIGVRIDIPAYLSKGVYVQTVHEPATPGNVGDRIGYDTHIRLKNGVKFFVKEGSSESRQGAVAIKEGRANKHPIATVEGSYSKDRTTPKDINDWTAVGMNPDKHSYFYDKKTDRPVIGGDESYSVNNTVFVKNPVYGKKSDFRFLPEIPTAPQDTKFNSVTEQGGKMLKGDYKNVIPGAILGTLRFLPESENARILANFPLDDSAKKKMEGKAGFAFASDWSDSNRPYLTKNGRKIDVLMGGVGYTYHPEVIGKGGWAGSFSALTNRVLKKINQTDGIGLVVAGGRESTASSRSFSIAALEEIKDDIANGTISKAAIDNIIKNNAERLLGLTSVKSLSDYEKLLMLERGGSGLTFEQRAEMVKAINSHENKKKFGLSSWNDILKKYEMQSGSFEPGQIMSVVQFDKNAPLIKASDLNIKGHKSYEAVIQGKPLGMLKEKVMIADFFKDFFTSEGTLPASYTRKVQTKMPSFKYGEGSAILKEAAKSIANAEKLK